MMQHGTTHQTRSAAGTTYQLLVTLQDSTPLIWRRIQVPGTTTLAKLHRILQVVMGWEDYHLHQFISSDGICYGPLDPDGPDGELDFQDERRVRLQQLAPTAGLALVYEYDFGDGWEHFLLVERVWRARADGRSASAAICLAGGRACPPEDSGGVGGYEHLLTALQDPTHPEHDELRAWARRDGTDYDPDAFSLEAVNAALKRLR